MANVYVWSGAGGAGTGADWTNAYTTWKVAAEAAGTAAGDNLWVAHDHNETGAVALSVTNKNTKAAPGTVICVNRAGSVPPVEADLRTTAVITTTGNSNITPLGVVDGWTYVYGIILQAGSGAVSAFISFNQAGVGWILHNCKLRKLGTTGSTNSLDFSSRLRLINTTVQFGATADVIRLGSSTKVEWQDTPSAVEGAVFPTTLFGAVVGGREKVIHGVDLSAIAGTLVGNFTTTAFDVRLNNCKINAAVTPSAAQANLAGSRVWLMNCDSAVNYRNEYRRHIGVQTTENTIVRSGGFSDGVTPISCKIVTTVDSKWLLSFESLPMTIWNDAVGSPKTVNVYGYWNNAAAPNNDDIWIEAIYLGDVSSPLSSTASSGKANFLAPNAAILTDGSTWGGGAGTTKFKMSCTLTPQKKGPITVTVKAAKANSTFYIDPKIEVV